MDGKYHFEEDGSLRNVDDLRDLVHDLACELYELAQDPRIQMLQGPAWAIQMATVASLAHDCTCPHVAQGPAQAVVEVKLESPEGPLGRPEIPGLEGLRELFESL